MAGVSDIVPGFTGPLVIEEIGIETWRVVEPFSFLSKNGLLVDVPQGFITDLASVPKVFRSVVPQIGYWNQAAVVHDLLYRHHRDGLDTTILKQHADYLLLEGCRVKAALYNVPDSERKDWLLYGGVRAAGLESWETPEERIERLARFDNAGII